MALLHGRELLEDIDKSTRRFAIVDSHVHLWPASELHTLRWNTRGGPLDGQYSVDEYEVAQGPRLGQVKGFVYVETDRISKPTGDDADWLHVFEEVDFITRVYNNECRPGEGHENPSQIYQIAAVLWAPMPCSPNVLERYVSRLKDRIGPSWKMVKGFRYLVQDKPRGTMLTENFVESLKWLGCNGFTFDLGIDCRSGGSWQLYEAVQLARLIYKGVGSRNRVKVVINHMGKPDMTTLCDKSKEETQDRFLSFALWQQGMEELASYPDMYMKLSGGFSETDELPPEHIQNSMEFWERDDMLHQKQGTMKTYIQFCLRHFGPSRCMFGSNWPVENINGGGNGVSWLNWWSVMRPFCDNLETKDAAMVWAGTASQFYGLEIDAK